jgi:hypothetical protein
MSSKKGNPSPRQRHRGSARADEVMEEARVGTQDSIMGHGGGQHEALFAEHRYEFHRRGTEVRSQPWSWAQSRVHCLSTLSTLEGEGGQQEA